MKKLIAVIIVAIIVVAGGAYWLTHNDSTTTINTKTNQPSTKATYAAVNSCNVLTEAVASQVLGATPTNNATSIPSISSSHLSASGCRYTAGGSTVSLLVQAAKDSTGANANQVQFANLPRGSQWIAGYGAKAYWDPQAAQLDILYNNNWYILSHYSGTTPTSATLDQAQVLADALQGNLK